MENEALSKIVYAEYIILTKKAVKVSDRRNIIKLTIINDKHIIYLPARRLLQIFVGGHARRRALVLVHLCVRRQYNTCHG